jgi:hypothetical protein
MTAASKRLHICTFNHDRYGVSDQVSALVEMLEGHAVVTVSDELTSGVDNLLIENFNYFQADEIRKHQTCSNGRLFVLLTEHLELDSSGRLLLNDQLWSARREYIPNLYERFMSLVELSDVIDGFVVLYGAPKMAALKTVFPAAPILDLAAFKHYPADDSTAKDYDFCFVGSETRHRRAVIEQLRTRFTVYFGTSLSTEERRNVIRRSRFTLNIPQHSGWTNLSPMRVIASAREGGRVINVADVDGEPFPYVTTIALAELLRMKVEDVHARSREHDRVRSSSPSRGTGLGQFVRWLS